ncbi:helix-turn-helix transcriptional regulator [Cytobacillus gottheilii]|uniref:helix-turn-helix transcriptional regulator n=1 Tax=Cytobacillus gottheilii TaxID=859144 RepID=UPI0009BC1DA1|nr:helix-turn-helix transcriptional regulator [Cytobacillus gottheilii]
MRRLWLETYRIQKKCTQQQVADSVDITRQYYGMIENGERTPSVSIAKKIAVELGFQWTVFFEEEEENN